MIHFYHVDALIIWLCNVCLTGKAVKSSECSKLRHGLGLSMIKTDSSSFDN